MKEKIQEKSEALQKIVNTINQGKQQINELEQEALMLQGELRLLKELDIPIDKPVALPGEVIDAAEKKK